MKSGSCRKSRLSYCLFTSLLFFTGAMVYGQPVAKFITNSTSGCAPILVNFTDQSTGSPEQWKWDLGNGTISYLQNPSVIYFNPGFYTVKLTVRTSTAADSLVKVNYITVFAAPVVDFTASQTTGCNILPVNFTNHTISNISSISSWQWDFGDGILSAEQNPSHTYNQTGNYNVSLKASNSNGCTANFLKTGYIKINGIKAGFSNTVYSRCSPTKIIFQNTSNGNGVISYKWFFGNGDSSSAVSPTYIYSAGGNYAVKLFVKNQYDCVDSVIKNIRVDTPVSAAFTVNTTTGCKPPVAIHFTNQVLTGNTYSWDFGDTTFAAASSPVHLYNDTGKYTVQLIVRNTNGCVDSVKKTDLIKIQKPFASINNLPDSGCGPLTKQLSVSWNGADSIVNYWWNFGDGSTATTEQSVHTFTTQGYNPVTLIVQGVTGCRDTVAMANAIRVNTKPAGNFSADIRNTCANREISFTDLTAGGATGWQWFFGDNSQSADQHPKHVFTDTGFLMVQLVVSNGGCTDTVTMPRYVYIKPAVSKFTQNFNCANPFNYSFSNFSIGADQWTWDFGDGATSAQLNPVHTYSDTGAYKVSLTTVNQATGCMFYLGKPVKIVKVVSNFFASNTALCKGSATTFTATIRSDEVSRFIWYFGDGTFERTFGNTITHIYEQPGIYSVKLIFYNLVNCRDSVIKQGYIKVNGPKANFGTSVAGTCANSPFLFNDSSSTDGLHAIQSWQWNYGDGYTETLYTSPFVHRYTNRGNYLVSLKITDNNGCVDSFSSPVPVVIKKLNPLLMAYDTVACTNKEIRFVAPYAEPGVSYRWDFGDGGSATVQVPTHAYAAEGEYTVKMVISHQLGCTDSSIHTNYIEIKNPVAKFSMSDSFRTCPPLVIQFTNSSVNAINEQWDFGDGTFTNTRNPSHFYSYPGIYTATLTVQGRGGCYHQMQKQIIVKGPKGIISYNPLSSCKAQPLNFSVHSVDAVSYTWDFNDGTTVVNSDSDVVHAYANGGKYVPKIMLADDNGCKVPVNGNDTINMVNVSANFNVPDSIICGNRNITFSNSSSSSENIAGYYWNFGDSSTANNITTPVHQYNQPGIFYPSLIIKTISGCTDSFYSAMPVKVSALPNVTMQAGANGCVPLNAIFSSTVDTSTLQWHWDFGNGNTSVLQNPPQQIYTAAGAYTVKMVAVSIEGCEKMISKTIQAYATPSIDLVGDSVICKGKNTKLVIKDAASYSWNTTSGLSCSDCASPLASPDSTITYVINAANANGCRAKDSVTVKVMLPFKMNFGNSVKVCSGKSAHLYAAGAASYEWWPAKGLNNIHSSEPLVSTDSSAAYRIIGEDAKGCFKDTGYVTVSIIPLPAVNAGEDIKIANGSPTDLVPMVSADVTSVNWSPTDGVFRNSDNGITVRPLVSTEYTVEVKNAAGCMAKDKINVTVINTEGEIFIPNTFSPNANGSNDIFYPRSAVSIKINRLKIFNRAGVTVFEKMNFYTNDVAGGWDGTYKGVRQATDVFVYAIEIVGAYGKPHVLTGNVALLQ